MKMAEDDALLAAAAYIVLNDELKKQKRKPWVLPNLQLRNPYVSLQLIDHLTIDDLLMDGQNLPNFIVCLMKIWNIYFSMLIQSYANLLQTAEDQFQHWYDCLQL